MRSRNRFSKPEGKEDENDQITEIKFYSQNNGIKKVQTDRDVARTGGL